MDQNDKPVFHSDIAQKADAVLHAIGSGHCRIASIANATNFRKRQ